jgi:hypothetical protein
MIVHDTKLWGLSGSRNPQGIYYEDWSIYERSEVIKVFHYDGGDGFASAAASRSGIFGRDGCAIHGGAGAS